MIELQEVSAQLKEEIKMKKKNMKVLESLLKDSKYENSPQKLGKPKLEEPPRVNEIVAFNFYVTCNDGLCVEFNKNGNTKVWQLKDDVRSAFLSRDLQLQTGNIEIKLIHKGKILIDEAMLHDYNISRGDNIAAIVSFSKTEVEVKENTVPVDNVDIVEELKKQQGAMAETFTGILREGLEGIVSQKVSQKIHFHDNNSSDISSQFTKLVTDVRYQLDSQLEFIEHRLQNAVESSTVPTRKASLNLGDVQSDDEEQRNDCHECLQKISGIEKLLEKLPPLEKKIVEQQDEIDSLEARLRTLATINQMSNSEFIKVKAIPPERPTKISKSANFVAPAGADNKPLSIGHIEAEVITVAPPPVVQKNEEMLAIPPQKPERERLSLPESKTILIFSREQNSDLPRDVEITVPPNISKDDLVYEIRIGLADALSIPLTRVALICCGKSVTLGCDIQGELTPDTAADFSRSGNLCVKITKGKPLTDTQLDQLVDEWEVSTKATSVKATASIITSVERMNEVTVLSDTIARKSRTCSLELLGNKDQQKLLLRRSLSNDLLRKSTDPSTDPSSSSLLSIIDDAKDDKILHLRKSYEDLLEKMNFKKGLTDDELREEQDKLKKDAETFDESLIDHVALVRNSIVGAVAFDESVTASMRTSTAGAIRRDQGKSSDKKSFKTTSNNVSRAILTDDIAELLGAGMLSTRLSSKEKGGLRTLPDELLDDVDAGKSGSTTKALNISRDKDVSISFLGDENLLPSQVEEKPFIVPESAESDFPLIGSVDVDSLWPHTDYSRVNRLDESHVPDINFSIVSEAINGNRQDWSEIENDNRYGNNKAEAKLESKGDPLVSEEKIYNIKNVQESLNSSSMVNTFDFDDGPYASDVDLNQTVESDITFPPDTRNNTMKESYNELDNSAVKKRADHYERSASKMSKSSRGEDVEIDRLSSKLDTPPSSATKKVDNSKYSKASVVSNASPFGKLQRDYNDSMDVIRDLDDGVSLTLSESNETLGFENDS